MRAPEAGQRGWWPWAVILGVGAAAGTAPRLLQPADAPKPEAAVEATAPTAPADVSAKLRPVLNLIGESLGAGPDTEQAAAARSVRVLLRYLAVGANDERQKALEDLRLRLDRPDAAPTRAQAEQVLELLSLPIANLKDADELVEARKQLLGFLRSEASDGRLLERLHRRAERIHVDVDFVVAGIADYVDSNIGWYADQHLEAIQAAMVTAGYTLDRFYLPEWPRATNTHAHRETPGAVIFRGRPNDEGRTPLRVLLLVPETPTAGLHREALRNALTLARTWDLRSPAPIRILGPTFSGSVASLRRVLQDDSAIWHKHDVRIVTGTATTATNATTLEGGSVDERGRQWVHFSSTSHPFPEWLRALKRYLATIDGSWADGYRVAVLHESNTTFGSVSVHSDPNGLLGVFPSARTIAFPMHISRLRDAAADAVLPARVSIGPRALIPLMARDTVTATDQLPSLTPNLTGASVQTTMRSVFDSLRYGKFRVIVIIATDERDRLYLAREVRRTSPDTQLVFFGAHMLLLHPDYAAYTRGGLVVSSYLLAGSTPTWSISAPSQARRHFQSWSAEGIYNAVLALTHESKDLVDYAVAAEPDDIGQPDGVVPMREGPPVWVSTVGRSGFVALASYPATPDAVQRPIPFRGSTFLHLPEAPNRERDPDFGGSLPLPAFLCLFGLALAVGWHISVVVRQVWAFVRRPTLVQGALLAKYGEACGHLPDHRNLRWLRIDPVAARAHYDTLTTERTAWRGALKEQSVTGFRRVFVLPSQPDVGRTARACVRAAFGVIGLLVAWWVYLAVRYLESPSYAWPILSGVFAAAPALLLRIPERPSVKEPPPDDAHPQGYTFAWTLALVIFGGVPAFALILGLATANASSPVPLAHGPLMEAERGLRLASLVSPTVPIVCFAVCAYVWLIWQLRVLSFVGDGYATLFGRTVAASASLPTGDSGSLVAALLAGSLTVRPSQPQPALPRWRREFTRAFDTTLPAPGRWKPLAIAGLAVAIAAPIVWLRVYTVEGPRFTGLFRVATLGGLFLATLALAQTWDQWRRVAGALTRLGRSPLAPAFAKVRSFHLDWRLNLRLPRRSELALLMAETDALEATLARPRPAPGSVPLISEGALRERAARKLLASSTIQADGKQLCNEFAHDQDSDLVRLMDTETFVQVWARTQRYLPLLQDWYDAQGHLPDKAPHTLDKAADRPTPDLDWIATDWFERAQGAVALTLAFVIRDVLSRIVAGLSAACACFVLLLAAHLLYSFPGRSTMLTIDWIAVGVSGAVAVGILVAMERSVVLSHLWDSAPGRVSFNREFVQRVALYGALPALTLISALFPEMGDTLFGWLAPARQAIGF